MNADFEKHLQRQPLRDLPRDWRAEIMAAASPAAGSRSSTLVSRLSSWFRPCPRAWAGLGVAWLVILGLNLAAGKSPSPAANAIAPCSREALLELRQQQLMLAKLISRRRWLKRNRPSPPIRATVNWAKL